MRQKEPIIRMRRKIDREDGFQEGEVIETWSRKRIGVAIVVTMLLIGAVGYGLISWTDETLSKPVQELRVLGQSSTEDVKLPTQDDIENTLETAREELEKISTENVTASDAAIQKVIQDLQSIQGGGKEPIDVVCEMLCKK